MRKLDFEGGGWSRITGKGWVYSLQQSVDGGTLPKVPFKATLDNKPYIIVGCEGLRGMTHSMDVVAFIVRGEPSHSAQGE